MLSGTAVTTRQVDTQPVDVPPGLTHIRSRSTCLNHLSIRLMASLHPDTRQSPDALEVIPRLTSSTD